MRLKRLINERWKICAPLDEQNQTEVESFLDGLDNNFKSNVHGILAIMERYSKHGPEGMNDGLCHLANRKEKIWEFVKGRLRIYWFDAGNEIVLCVCGCIKKTDKVDPTMVNKAIQVRNEYFRLKAVGASIEILEGEE